MVQVWKRRSSVFASRWAEALEDNIELLEKSLFVRAMEGDTTAAMFLLKAARPAKYRERYELVVNDHDLDRAIEEEFRQLALAAIEPGEPAPSVKLPKLPPPNGSNGNGNGKL